MNSFNCTLQGLNKHNQKENKMDQNSLDNLIYFYNLIKKILQ